MKKIGFSKIKKFFQKLPRFLAEKAFLVFLFLFFLGIIFSLIVYYFFIFSIEKRELKVPKATLKFQEETYQSILEIWQKKEERFGQTNSKQYPDLFQAKKSD